MDGYIKELDMNTKNIGVRPAMVISLK